MFVVWLRRCLASGEVHSFRNASAQSVAFGSSDDGVRNSRGVSSDDAGERRYGGQEAVDDVRCDGEQRRPNGVDWAEESAVGSNDCDFIQRGIDRSRWLLKTVAILD